jgi:beta-lactamase regulating signal transducer with metallopeptidase domain
MIDFILKSTFSLGLFYVLYVVLLEREKMHRFNRLYLLFGLVFSLLIPFFTFEIYVETTVVAVENTVQAMPFSSVVLEEKTDYIPLLLWSIYALVTSVLLARFVLNLIKIQRKVKTSAVEKMQSSTLVLLDEKVLPHTFLNYIFINKDDYENKKIEGELFAHELTHVRQKHTFDILCIELLKTIFWFNPILILYKKAIQLNHEFLADETVVQSYNNVPFYQNLLVEKASWNNTFYLASNLNFLVTKKRLIMMTKTTSSKTILLKKMSLLPVLTLMIYFLCFETVAQQKNQPSKTKSGTTKVSDDKKLDAYFAGVRFILYKKDSNTTKADLRKDLIFDKVYEDLTPEDKAKMNSAFLTIPKAFVKKSPTQKELDEFKNAKKFAIWIDGKNVPNSELNKYKPKEIAYFSGSVILKNARTQKHPQPFQYWFYTHPYFDKNEMGKQATKYGGDKVEVFQNFDKKTVTKKATTAINITEKQVPNNPSEDGIYTSVEKRPEYPGGMQAFYDFVGKNFHVPEVKDLKGRIYIQFIVEKDGSLTNIKSLRDIGHGTGEEAIRVLKLSQNWIPGEQDGQKVRVLFSLPISISGN